MLPVFRLPVFLRLGQTRPGTLNHFRTVSHELSLLQYFLNGFQLRFAQLAGGSFGTFVFRSPVRTSSALWKPCCCQRCKILFMYAQFSPPVFRQVRS